MLVKKGNTYLNGNEQPGKRHLDIYKNNYEDSNISQ